MTELAAVLLTASEKGVAGFQSKKALTTSVVSAFFVNVELSYPP